MNPSQLGKRELMQLLISEAIRDRQFDANDKQLIRRLGQKLGLSREEIEKDLADVLAAKSQDTASPTKTFDPIALFSAASELALADGVFSRDEEQLLFSLKEVLGIPDANYQESMNRLFEKTRRSAGDAREATEDTPAPQVIDAPKLIESIIGNIEKVIVGKRDVIRLLLTAAMANSHVLLEDVPGTGKTVLARALAASIDCTCRRVQFTPDLLPMDITGSMIFNPQTGVFSFKKGPAFTNVFLADEINRATPRTQSSLLEVMEERQISIDGATYPMARVFIVLATQNPIEQHGTYPLPEAQLDRFLFKLSMGYPDPKSELQMLTGRLHGSPLADLKTVASLSTFAALQTKAQKDISASPEIMDYLLSLISALRTHADLVLGPSPRASIALLRASTAYACLSGRDFVIPEDIKILAEHVLAHRLALKPQALVKRVRPADIVADVVGKTPVPVTRKPA